MRKPTTSTKATSMGIVLLLVSLFLIMTVGSMFGLVILPTVIAAVLLAAFFDWRATLRSRVVTDHDDYKKAA